MDKSLQQQPLPPTPSSGPKVSQIANIFQRRPVETTPTVSRECDTTKENQSPASAVVRTESHAARFNHARALFERLGESKINRPTGFSITMTHSTSKEDNLKLIDSEKQQTNNINNNNCGNSRSPSPKRKHVPNGVGKMDPSKIHNVSRLKSEKPEKPEKPERKFNSRELIEKQKNWTAHFSKTRTTKYGGEHLNRCDIIRTVPGTGIVSVPEPKCNKEVQQRSMSPPTRQVHSPIERPPPSPPVRQTSMPETKPRSAKQPPPPPLISPTKSYPVVPAKKPELNCLSPTKQSPERIRSPSRQHNEPPPPIRKSSLTKSDEVPEKQQRKRSIDLLEDQSQLPPPHSKKYPELGAITMQSVEKENNVSPGNAISSSPSPGASVSSGPSSPIHTEDEKQENEENEKAEFQDDNDGEFVFVDNTSNLGNGFKIEII
jgi:neurabin